MSSSVCAGTIVAQLCAQGVTEAVLAPGSRSAPLALALAQAEADGRLRLHVRFDERSAGFLALGLAKASGRPVPVVTTSGTAVGNLMPAVLEAHHGGVPLLVLSADRPASLVGFGANQTTDQSRLFQPFVRWSARVSSEAAAASWAAQAARACLLAAGLGSRNPGPVHLNVELDQPLVGEVALPSLRPVTQEPAGAVSAAALAPGPRTVVICGDASVEVGRQAAQFASGAGLPLVAEPSSNARVASLRTGRLLLGSALADELERVVVFGRPTLSRPVNRLLARDDVEIVVVSPGPEWPDAGWRTARVVPGLCAAGSLASDGWLDRWHAADRALSAQVDEVLAGQDVLTGPAVASAVVESVGDGMLMLGNSQPIRDADLAEGSAARVFANRGLAGIDGTISTAVGIAWASERPLTLLCGDLTFLHDGNGLAAGLGERRPDLRILVADDSGGSIFATLEYGDARYATAFERVFATPPGIDPVRLAEAHGVPVRRVGDLSALTDALRRPIKGLDVVVATVDRAGRRALNDQLNALADLIT